MHAKLTLRLESDLIERAKQYAAEKGKSVSQMVGEYFSLMKTEPNIAHKVQEPLPPITAKLLGFLEGYSVDAEDYKKHLEQKYL